MWAERAIGILNQVYPHVEPSTWDQCKLYLPHALVCASLIKRWEMKSPEAGRLLHETGAYLYEQAQYAQAEPLLEEALAIREHNLGSNHPEVADTLGRLADLYQKQAKFDQAAPLREQVLKIRESTLGSDHPDM